MQVMSHYKASRTRIVIIIYSNQSQTYFKYILNYFNLIIIQVHSTVLIMVIYDNTSCFTLSLQGGVGRLVKQPKTTMRHFLVYKAFLKSITNADKQFSRYFASDKNPKKQINIHNFTSILTRTTIYTREDVNPNNQLKLQFS